MIIKEINKRIVAIVTLCLFLLSTNGMVLFYHYCQHGNTLAYSMFIDATSDQCKGNANEDAEFHNHHPEVDCCDHDYNDQDNQDCCKEHKSCKEHKTSTKTLKLKNEYHYSEKQATPKPIWLKLWIADIIQHSDLPHCALHIAGGWRELPLEKPLFQHSGTQLLTLYHTFKIAC